VFNYILLVVIKFLVSVNEQSKKLDTEEASNSVNSEFPSPRSHSGLTFKHNTLFIYGGIIEKGSKSLTLRDFYSLGKDYFAFYLIKDVFTSKLRFDIYFCKFQILKSYKNGTSFVMMIY